MGWNFDTTRYDYKSRQFPTSIRATCLLDITSSTKISYKCTGNVEPSFYLFVALHICDIICDNDAMRFRAGYKILNQLKVSFLSAGIPNLELDFSTLDVDSSIADIESHFLLFRR